MIAELDAISLYEQLAAMTDRADNQKGFLDIAREEKPMWANFRNCFCVKTKSRLQS